MEKVSLQIANKRLGQTHRTQKSLLEQKSRVAGHKKKPEQSL
jgi:cellobiose-specific phosphotransferase system component IIA